MTSWFSHLLASQFRKPRGILGRIVSNKMLKLNKAPYDWVMSEMRIGPDHRVLEIGFGPGYGIRLVSDIISSGTGCICGIDFSKSMCQRARQAHRRMMDAKKARLELGDAAKMPFADGYFNFAFAVNVIYFWKDLSGCLVEIRRVLCPGGKIALYLNDVESLKALPMTQTGVFQYYQLHEVIAALESAGFSQVTSKSKIITQGRERLGHLVLATIEK